MVLKDNKADDPPINFDNFHSNYGGGGGGSSDFFSFGNSSSSSNLGLSTSIWNMIYAAWNAVSNSGYNYGTFSYENGNVTYSSYGNVYYSHNKGSWGYWSNTNTVSINHNSFPTTVTSTWITIRNEINTPTISNHSGNTNIQYAGMFGGNPTTGRDFVNYLYVMAGSIATHAEIILRNEKGKLETLLANGEKVAHKLKMANADIHNLGKFSRKLGIAGLFLQGSYGIYDYTSGEGVSASQIFDLGVSGLLLGLSFSHPLVLSGLAAYSILDMAGALDGIKGALGGNMIIIQGYSKQK